MDARFTALFALPLALAACSSSRPAPQAPAETTAPRIFEALIDQPAAPDSLIRQGDQVTYMVFPTAEKPWMARFDASCSQAGGMMFYNTGRGMRAFTDDASHSNLPQPQAQALQQSEQLRQACAYRPAPDWHALDTREGENWPLLDRNSAVQEDGLLKVWTASQLARYKLLDRGTQIGQEQERLAIDCGKQAFKRLSRFSIDSKGRVFSGAVDKSMSMTPVAQATGEQRRLIATACQQPDTWASLAVAPQRQPLTPQLAVPSAAPAVLTAIEALKLPEPRLSLQGLEYRYDALVMHRMNITDVQRDDVFSRDTKSGQLLVQPTDSALGTELLLTFRGLIKLAKSSFDEKTGEQVADSLHITGLAFQGDWQQLPENATVVYYKTQHTEEKPFTSIVNCTVGAALPASRIHPQLQGRAKPLTCKTIKPELGGSERFNYLEDYGVFVQQEQDSVLGRWTWRVKSVH